MQNYQNQFINKNIMDSKFGPSVLYKKIVVIGFSDRFTLEGWTHYKKAFDRVQWSITVLGKNYFFKLKLCITQVDQFEYNLTCLIFDQFLSPFWYFFILKSSITQVYSSPLKICINQTFDQFQYILTCLICIHLVLVFEWVSKLYWSPWKVNEYLLIRIKLFSKRTENRFDF